MVDSNHHDDEQTFEEWPFDDLDAEDLEPEPPPTWRRPFLIAVAALTAAALALVPIYNVIFNARTVADNGLEVCGFDYCVVQEAVRSAGLDLTMSELANSFLDEAEARSLASELTNHLEIPAVAVFVVDRLEGRLGGVYDSGSREIAIESPARAWTVLHEVAHAVSPGHGQEFHEVVIDLARYMSQRATGVPP